MDNFVIYVGNKKEVVVGYEFTNKDGVVSTLEGDMPYKNGDVILTGSLNEKWAISFEKFNSNYRILSNTQAQFVVNKNKPRFLLQIHMSIEESDMALLEPTTREPINLNGQDWTFKGNDIIVQMELNSTDFFIIAREAFDLTYEIYREATLEEQEQFSDNFYKACMNYGK